VAYASCRDEQYVPLLVSKYHFEACCTQISFGGSIKIHLDKAFKSRGPVRGVVLKRDILRSGG